MKSFDALILGGGCSGLSLAMAGARSRRVHGTIGILEPRESYVDDRTWCYWNVHHHPHEDLVGHSWRKWRVSTDRGETTTTSSAYSYCQIRSGDFYRKAQWILEANPRCELLTGVHVSELVPSPGGWEVSTTAGKFQAPLVFDSRPPAQPVRGGSAFWQHFLGWRVRFDRDCMDPGVATLMDFQTVSEAGVHFVYVLPEDRRTALVESTFLGPTPFPRETYEAILSEYLNRSGRGAGYEILGREEGRIPMMPIGPSQPPRPGLIPIGACAGCIKPSSGYGFLGIQRHTESILHQWESGTFAPEPQIRTRTARWMDGVFLHWLRRNPKQAPAMFYNLFRRVPPDSLVRFLSEQPEMRDVVKVILAMPGRGFLASAVNGALTVSRS